MSAPDTSDRLAREYHGVLRRYLDGSGEAALNDAYEVGRRALDGGLGPMDIANIHHKALSAALAGVGTTAECARGVSRAALVEAESLSVFEMALRGYREVNNELRRTNEQLRQLAGEQQAAAAAERDARMALQEVHHELKRAQGQLVQSAKLAALGEIVAGVAHEINNPLAFVVNNTAVLRRDVHALCEIVRLYQADDAALATLDPAQHARIRSLADDIDLTYVLGNVEDLMNRSSDGLARIRRIVQDLRAFARVEESAHVEVTDLAGGIESTLNIIRGQARDRGVELIAELSPLPPVVCSPGKINQVVLNLVANALDACEEGGRVTVRTTATEAGVEIHVSDTGHGIDAAIRDRIFDPFFTTKSQGQGTGLGLSISHGIVAEHDGRIDVESSREGTRFVVHLPLRPAARPRRTTGVYTAR